MTRIEFAIDTVKVMRNGMRDLGHLQVTLQLKNILAHRIDLAVLLL